jgi:hypothetical protein
MEDNTAVLLDIPAGQVYTYNLNAAEKAKVHSGSTGTSRHSLHMESTLPVSVYALNMEEMTTDATNVLPVNSLGKAYYLLSYMGGDNMAGPNVRAPDGYTVVAVEDHTEVYENGILKATLNRGEVYSRYETDTDLTGRHITSNYPVACFVMGDCAYVPVGTGGCDCLFQQMAPVNSWGNTFLVPVTRRGLERVRIVASQNSTTIHQTGGTKKTDGGGGALNPANENSFTLNAGEYAELEIKLSSGGCFIEADKPIAVASYLLGITYPGLSIPDGDPSLAWVPPIQQNIAGVSIAPFVPTGVSRLSEHHALVVTATNTRSQTTLAIGNNPPASLSGGSWITGNGTGGSDYSFYSVPLTSASASYYFYNPHGLVVMGYGLGNYESYYYLAGASGRNLEMAFYLNEVHYQDMDGQAFFSAQTFAFRGSVQYAMNATPGYLKWYINGMEETAAQDALQWNKTLEEPGNYLIEMKVLDLYNQLHTISTNLVIGHLVPVNPHLRLPVRVRF